MARPLREVPPALEGNDTQIAAVGAAAWAAALIVLAILEILGDLPPSRHWWIWTCAVGVGLGVFGVLYIPRIQRSRARSAG
jgi:predicted lysophospholipase L1 biosynthesis ABC-type transport system permease subunit